MNKSLEPLRNSKIHPHQELANASNNYHARDSEGYKQSKQE